jgi:transposase
MPKWPGMRARITPESAPGCFRNMRPHHSGIPAQVPPESAPGSGRNTQLCRERLRSDPFSGAVFVFRSRRGHAVKLLVYDGQGFWLCHKRLSQGKFGWWPTGKDGEGASMRPHELQVLLFGGDPSATKAAPVWREIRPPT